MEKKQQQKLTFKEAVEATPDVATGYHKGIEAFGKYTSKIKVPESSKIDGSLDIDATTSTFYPNESRWDYALCYDSEVFYIEVHSAITSEVTKIVKKLQWLKIWLAIKAPEINKLTSKTKHPYYWVQSSKCNIPKHMRQYKIAVQNKILPIPIWDYSKICKKGKN
ncbi:hypothetical protein [Prevotella intermedia]|jgi:hypothetical protein|uniref:hypothetical protein n=1 Tax=Prevotella intermedia TaxID=28131 RepID=UPI000C1C58F5|nr:hypothetical protein [Prevotella intermedia]ATV28290.1 hypothetical protein CTM63_03555 [Prevotella intermedia]MCK6143093.1 hypothetical protein [Prevotella intermedia]